MSERISCARARRGHWSERLSLGVTRALRVDLAARLPLDTVTLAPRVEIPRREILIDVEQFDVWPDGRCLLVASWSILGIDQKAVLAAGRGSFAISALGASASDHAVVAGMVNALAQLADAIAALVSASATSAMLGNSRN